MGAKFVIKETETVKQFCSDSYNYRFDKKTGFFARWGKTIKDDPCFSPFGPEILDIEVTTICAGPGGKLCPFCYKANTPNGKNMSYETFVSIFDKLPKTLTQIAFGADAQCESNEDIWDMMKYCRKNEIVPNITVADITDETATKLVDLCGAVAVSRYKDKDICYDSVKRLTDRGLKQTNIHVMLSNETYDQVIETINDCCYDDRLEFLNCVVFLSLKQTGRGTNFTPLTDEQFQSIVNLCLKEDVSFGFDSCSAPKFINSVTGHDKFNRFKMATESCESTLFSMYISTDGIFYPCSFAEHTRGVNVLEQDDFIKDIWFNEDIQKFRNMLLKGVDSFNIRHCPIYEV